HLPSVAALNPAVGNVIVRSLGSQRTSGRYAVATCGQGACRSCKRLEQRQGHEAALGNCESAQEGEGMRPVKLKLNEAQQQWVRNWWRALQPRADGDDHLPQELIGMGRGQRAQWRRCADVEELLVHPATLMLAD